MQYQFDWSVIWVYREMLLIGLRYTLILFLVGMVGSLILGVLWGVASVSEKPAIRSTVEWLIELNRNTPILVKLFFIYFGFSLGEFEASFLALALHQGAYNAEVVRAGIQSLPAGQMEAGLSSGLTRFQVMRRIVLPQAFVVVIPPLTTQVIETLKNTTIAMTVSIRELTFATQQIEVDTFRGFEAATAATLIYFAIILGIVSIAHVLERKLGRFKAKLPPDKRLALQPGGA